MGRNSKKEPIGKEISIQQLAHTTTATNTISQSKSQSTSDLATNTEKIEIKYRPTGKIQTKIITRKITVAQNQTDSENATVENKTIENTTQTNTKVKEMMPTARYLIGASINPLHYKDDVNIIVGLNVTHGVFVTASSDVKTFTPSVGLLITF